MKRLLIFIALAFGFVTNVLHAQAKSETSAKIAEDDWVYLDNGTIRLGVIRSSGGAIAFLAKSGSSQNLLNHYDRGRLIQQSYYGDEDGSLWEDKPWRYNPVQGGDYKGKSARLLELKLESDKLYTKSIPRHWATGKELPECILEQWITLNVDVVQVRFQMTYQGEKLHVARHQEIPAVFVDAKLATLITYDGDAPWTKAPLTRCVPGPTNEYFTMTENWVAYVDADDFGVGTFVPIATDGTCYRFLGGSGSDCSYVAPITTFALKPKMTFCYDAYFSIGTTTELRERFAAIRARLK